MTAAEKSGAWMQSWPTTVVTADAQIKAHAFIVKYEMPIDVSEDQKYGMHTCIYVEIVLFKIASEADWMVLYWLSSAVWFKGNGHSL